MIKPVGDWKELERILKTLPRRLPGAMRNAVNAEAQSLRGHVIKNITSGGAHAGQPFAKLSPMTLIIRRFRGFGGSKPLIVSASMRNAVSVLNTATGAFVGILRGAPHPSGRGAINVARVHEEGRTFTVPKTRKMIRFLAAAMRSAGQSFGSGGGGQVGQPGVIVIRIPARRFMSAVFERWGQPEDIADRFWSRTANALAGDIGRPG